MVGCQVTAVVDYGIAGSVDRTDLLVGPAHQQHAAGGLLAVVDNADAVAKGRTQGGDGSRQFQGCSARHPGRDARADCSRARVDIES